LDISKTVAVVVTEEQYTKRHHDHPEEDRDYILGNRVEDTSRFKLESRLSSKQSRIWGRGSKEVLYSAVTSIFSIFHGFECPTSIIQIRKYHSAPKEVVQALPAHKISVLYKGFQGSG